MKAYKVELLIVDHDELGPKEIVDVIENTRYANRCIAPEVMAVKSRDIGEWHDDHPLNFSDRAKAEYSRLFNGGAEQENP